METSRYRKFRPGNMYMGLGWPAYSVEYKCCPTDNIGPSYPALKTAISLRMSIHVGENGTVVAPTGNTRDKSSNKNGPIHIGIVEEVDPIVSRTRCE